MVADVLGGRYANLISWADTVLVTCSLTRRINNNGLVPQVSYSFKIKK